MFLFTGKNGNSRVMYTFCQFKIYINDSEYNTCFGSQLVQFSFPFFTEVNWLLYRRQHKVLTSYHCFQIKTSSTTPFICKH